MTAAVADQTGDSGGFVHLHVHTEYSMLDGAARLKDMFAQCEREGMSAVAMTDHGNLYGAYDFWSKGTKAGIKPIIGIEAYVAPEHRRHRQPVRWGTPAQKDDDVSGAGAYTHMTMLAETTEGMHNLFRLSSRASLEGQFRKPRMDREIISEHARGIMATTGCPSGEVQTRLRLGQYPQALEAAAAYRDIFGAGNFFVEIMDHGLSIEQRVRDGLRRIAKELDLPFVVTNDSHYSVEADAKAHEVLLCVQTGSNMADPGRFKFDGSGYYLKSPQEMRAAFPDEEWQSGCDSTLLIAERADVTFQPKNLMPLFDVPEGETEESWLRQEVRRGMDRRYPDGYDERRRGQVEYEMGIITQMGFCSYFLVVADFIMWAKRNGIWVGPGRGSAAGCLVAYALGITDLDPLKHGLIFERFLNPERVSMPDIDIDFDERRRGDVIRYVTEKWGDDRVAQIITYGTIKAKAAVKDSARVLGFPYALGDRITKAFPPAVMGKDIPLSGIFDDTHPRYGEAGEIRSLYEAEAEVRQVIDTARGLEGLIRQAGVHAAGVIMSSEPIIDHVPVWKREADGAVITQFDYPACESLGLLKMDFLGLRNLTVLDDAVRGIKANRDIDVDLETLPLDDKPTYDLLARGDTLGIFQFDGGPMRALLRSMRPDNFEDISAVGALYRPGPMGANAHNDYADRKNKRKPVVPIHPELAEPLAEILGDTYGLIVYQEQVMAIAQKVAGYSLGSADLLRRAMGKKKKEILDKEFAPFEAGMKANGYSASAIKTLWDILVPFSDYAFNKAHSAAYGLVSYWTAYLKANFPAEYMAGLLTSVSGDKDKSALYLNECRRMGITVLPPGRERVHGHVHPGRRRHPVRPGRGPQRRDQRGGRDRRGPRGQGRVHQLRRLPAQGAGRRVQEAGHRVAGEGGCVRLARASAQGPGHHPRAGHRHGDRRQAQGGHRPGLAVRRGRGDRGQLRGPGAGRGVGQDHAAGLRAGDARPVRVRSPAARRGAHRGREHRLLGGRTDQLRGGGPRGARPRPGRPPGRADGDRGRDPVRRAAEGHPAGEPVGHRHAGGPGRRARGAVLPGRLPAVLAAAGRGRDRHRERPAGPPG